ncbi:MAG: serine/threonine-protein phosphatase [Candidatus Omnitrophica bacterium]|nr:serine/threonine-protein phosphatase [Candidatus Omnitrophota bacterium]
MKKIPKIYLDEFFKQQTALLKNRVQIAAILFMGTFFAGTLIGSLALNEAITRQLILDWVFTVFISTAIIMLARKVSTFRKAKTIATLFMIIVLSFIARYQMLTSEAPFNAAISYIFIFFAFSLIFPWKPLEIVWVALLHIGVYGFYILNTHTYIFKDKTFTTELPDYIQGLITMFLSTWVCYIVIKNERNREAENFILLKEIENTNNQVQKELELATRVHSRLIPHSTDTRLGEIAVTYLPVSYMGGDYAKFYVVDRNKLIFIICDVTGHGVSAALLVNALNAEFERLAKEGKPPGILLKEMDQFIREDFAGVNMYLSAFCGLLDYRSRKFIYSSYGHLPQYIWKTADSAIEKIFAQSSFLGLPTDDENIYQNEMPFRKGDHIILFTDGVTETKNTAGEQYGERKLENFIRKNHGMSLELFNQQLVAELNSFSGGKFTDDIFVLTICAK